MDKKEKKIKLMDKEDIVHLIISSFLLLSTIVGVVFSGIYVSKAKQWWTTSYVATVRKNVRNIENEIKIEDYKYKSTTESKDIYLKRVHEIKKDGNYIKQKKEVASWGHRYTKIFWIPSSLLLVSIISIIPIVTYLIIVIDSIYDGYCSRRGERRYIW